MTIKDWSGPLGNLKAPNFCVWNMSLNDPLTRIEYKLISVFVWKIMFKTPSFSFFFFFEWMYGWSRLQLKCYIWGNRYSRNLSFLGYSPKRTLMPYCVLSVFTLKKKPTSWNTYHSLCKQTSSVSSLYMLRSYLYRSETTHSKLFHIVYANSNF